MGVFDEAYRQGLRAYDDAKRARKEITSLMDDVTQQVGRASDALLRVSWGADKPAPGEDSVGAVLFQEGIYASIGQFGKRRSIGQYSMTSRGYPVTLQFAGQEVRCTDRDTLAKGLAEMLRHPDTGSVFRWLVELQQRED